MPKLNNVTDEQIAEVVLAAEDLSFTLADYNGRIEKGYTNDLTNTLERVMTLNRAARGILELAGMLMFKAQLAEQKRDLEAALRSQLKA